MPRVTVLVTCYNHLAFLKEALASVRAQTFQDYEILAVDDGSSDGTRDFLAEQNLRTLFNETNLGTYGSLNAGIAAANGQWIAILNDDDLWAPTKLEEQMKLAEKYPFVHTSGTFIDDAGVRIEGAPLGFPFPHLPSGSVLPQLVTRNQVIVSSVLVRKDAVLEAGGFDPSFYGYGDWHLWLRLARRHEFGFVDLPLTHYRVHANQASRDNRKMEAESLRVREWISTWEGEVMDRDNFAEFAWNWRCIGASREMFGDKSGARKAFAKALKLSGSPKAAARWLASFVAPSKYEVAK
jgi:glycosyltransferase involved in cell wall biosynthesis